MESPSRKPVLILGSEPRVAVTIARSLNAHGIAVHVAALSDEEPAVVSKAVESFVRLPSPQQKPEAFRTALLAMVRDHQIDMILPSNDSALMALAQGYHDILDRLQAVGHRIHLGCPAPEVVQRVLDKGATLQTARQCGLVVPMTHQIAHAQELDQLRAVLRFPVALKPRSKWQVGAAKVRYFHSFTDLRRAVIRDPSLVKDALIQEYCPGIGIGIEVLMHGQEPVACFQHRRLKELPPTGGVSVLAESEPVDPVLANAAFALLRHLGWTGVAMVEFRYDPVKRQAVLMEVNGRYWGSLPLSYVAGLEFPFYEWQLAHGQTPDVPAQYRIGLRARWTRGSLLRAQELLRDPAEKRRWHALFETIRDLFPPTRDMLWSSTDPGPALIELGRTVSGLLFETLKAGVKILIPYRLFELARAYRVLGRRDGAIYVRRQGLRLLGVGYEARRPQCMTTSVRSILFVCHGNIMRSPMAANMLTQALRSRGLSITIRSAGLHAKPYGPADRRALMVAPEFGCSLEGHVSRMVNRAMVDQADVIFVMDRFNEAKLLGRFPQARGKVLLLGAYAEEDECSALDPDDLDIIDPYDGDLDDVRHCYERLTRCIQRVASLLRAGDRKDAEALPEVAANPERSAESLQTGVEPSRTVIEPAHTERAVQLPSGDMVSVIIPCYGQAQFLGEAIQSVMVQTGAPAEVIVVDDGSPDETARVAQETVGVQYIRQEHQGVAAARNRGLGAAQGQYVVFLDADDRLLPNHFQVSLQALKAHPQAAFVCGDYRWFGADEAWHVHGCEPEPDYYGTLLRSNFIGPLHPVMFRREFLLEAGGFRSDRRAYEHYELYLRMARQYPVHCHHEVVAEYRRHSGQASMDLAAMLVGGMSALQAQRRYLYRDPAYQEAYVVGVQQMQRIWAAPLVWEMVNAFREGRLRRAAHCCVVLAQYYPQGLVDLARHKMTVMLHREPA